MQANQNKNGIDLLNIVKANLDNKTKHFDTDYY